VPPKGLYRNIKSAIGVRSPRVKLLKEGLDARKFSIKGACHGMSDIEVGATCTGGCLPLLTVPIPTATTDHESCMSSKGINGPFF
jgi:hypothetical protein